jgi:hypothetical protein
MNPEELQAAQDAMIASIGDRTLAPTPGGAAGRAAAEHHAAAGLRARPDADQYADQIAGHEAAARALTEAALCEREHGDK